MYTKEIPPIDANVSVEDTFYITFDGSGYTIRPYNSSTYISAKNTTASGTSGAPDSYLTMRTYEDAGSRASWIIEGFFSRISDGVYSFENVANTNRWMDTEQDESEPGYHMQQYDYGDIPTVNFNRGALFKISESESAGHFIVRLMTNNRLTFSVDDGEFITKYIPTDDRDVDVEDTFSIVFWNTGYILIDYYGNVVSSDHPTASGMSGAPDSYLVSKTRTQAGNMGIWEMYRYTGTHKAQAMLTSLGEYIAGNEITVTVAPWSTGINANTPYVYLQNEDIAECDWDWDTLSAPLLLHDEGSLRIHVDIQNVTYDTVDYTGFVEKQVNLPYEEGVFYVRNRDSEKFMQTNNDDDPDFNTTDEVIEVQNFNAGHHQKWELIHAGDGYYYIKTYDSDPNESPSRNLYITVRSGYENSGNKYVAQSELNYSSTQKWKITDYTDGSFVLRPKSAKSYSTDWCLAEGSGSVGTNVEQRDYYHYSNQAHWFLYKCVGADDVFLLGMKEADVDRSPSFVKSIPNIFSLGYNEVCYIMTESFPVVTTLSYMEDCRLFVFRGHGNINSVSKESYISLKNGDLFASNIFNYNTNMRLRNFDNCELMLFVGCYTANMNGKGLPNAATMAGAECAIGFLDSIECESANKFTIEFFEYLEDGYTIREATKNAAWKCTDKRLQKYYIDYQEN